MSGLPRLTLPAVAAELAARGEVVWVCLPPDQLPWVTRERSDPAGRTHDIELVGSDDRVELWADTEPPSRSFHAGSYFACPSFVFPEEWQVTAINADNKREKISAVRFGVRVGSATIGRMAPVRRAEADYPAEPQVVLLDGKLLYYEPDDEEAYNGRAANISDQLPFSRWEPGFVAVELTDAEPA